MGLLDVADDAGCAMNRQRGLTLIELLLALAMSVLVLSMVASLVRGAGAANAVTMTQLEAQQQAQFAVRRILLQAQLAKIDSLSVKTDPWTSADWLSPALYELRPGSSALTETIGGVSRVIADQVTAFSVTSPDQVTGQSLVSVSVTVGDIATASGTARVGGAR
jgi:prepilin-type N-terminal cleavage/methylation domain-containing protein